MLGHKSSYRLIVNHNFKILTTMAIYHIKNRRGEHREDNWIRFWEEKTGLDAGQCHVLGCMKDAEDGAHVNLVDSDDKKTYIVPMCHQCNCQFGQEFHVVGPLVSVDGNTILP